MDGIHDLGGRQGFGRIRHTLKAQTFHEPWERRSTRLLARRQAPAFSTWTNIACHRARMEARHYLSASYYERSLTSLATLCVEKASSLREARAPRGRPLPAVDAERARSRNVATREKLNIGDKVTVRVEHIPGHVRAPGYVRGKTGVVVGISPAYPFPDAHAHGIHAEDEPTYDVRFNAEELWPNSADPAQVHVGIFESYLERAK